MGTRSITTEGMRCECGGVLDTVTDTRGTPHYVRRRRTCHKCGARRTTYEIFDTAFAVLDAPDKIAVKLDGVRRSCNAALEQLEESLSPKLRALLRAIR